jgi:hypothetical protein
MDGATMSEDQSPQAEVIFHFESRTDAYAFLDEARKLANYWNRRDANNPRRGPSDVSVMGEVLPSASWVHVTIDSGRHSRRQARAMEELLRDLNLHAGIEAFDRGTQVSQPGQTRSLQR